MPSELLAVLAALFYACGHITVKFGTRDGGIVFGFLVSLGTGIVALTVVALLNVEDWAIPVLPAALFALAGIAGPGAGRVLMMRGVRDAGTSVAAPVQSSTNPVLSSLAGVMLFGEVFEPIRAVALVLIVGGIWACARGGSANQPGATLAGEIPTSRWRVLLWPLLAGSAFATADVFRKFGLAEFGDPVLAALIGVTVAFLIWLTVYLVSPAIRATGQWSWRLLWFCAYGLFSAAGLTSLLFALRGGDLSVVIPIFASQPVLVIVLGAVLLRNLEKLRTGTVVGATIAFVGIASLSLA